MLVRHGYFPFGSNVLAMFPLPLVPNPAPAVINVCLETDKYPPEEAAERKVGDI